MGVLDFEKMRSVKAAKIKPGQTVLLRTDFDVPLKENKIVDEFRLKAALPTIKFLFKKKVKIILISHLGRPRGKVEKTLRLNPIAHWLERNLKTKVIKLETAVGPIVNQTVKKLLPGQIILLENLRFYPEEEKNDLNFAKKLTSLSEFFVNEAFAVCHREHASIVGTPKFLPSFAGLRLEKEVKGLKKALKAKKDLLVILGGAKTETKIPVIESLAKLGSVILLGGVVGNTFLAAFLGRERMGGEIIQGKDAKLAEKFLRDLDKPVSFAQIPGKTTKIWLPLDLWVADEKTEPVPTTLVDPYNESIPKDYQVYGLGPKTLKEYAGLISQAKALIWNGPVSRPHPLKTPRSTEELGRVIAKRKVFSIVGGGDTVATLAKESILDKIDLVSTGGGAMLEFLNKGTLPGIEVLEP